MIKKSFYSVRMRNLNDLRSLLQKSSQENTPILFCLNHSNWWDAAFVVWLSIRFLKIDSFCLMELKQLQSNKFFNSLGAIPIVREDARQSLKTLQFATKVINSQNKALWIFPQGEIIPNDIKPYKFYSGISHIIPMLDKVTLVKLFFDYRFTSEQRPEVFIDYFGYEKFTGEIPVDKKQFTRKLELEFEIEKDSLKEKILKNNFGVFEIILQGKKSIDRKPNQ